jgi:hypothetical protein
MQSVVSQPVDDKSQNWLATAPLRVHRRVLRRFGPFAREYLPRYLRQAEHRSARLQSGQIHKKESHRIRLRRYKSHHRFICIYINNKNSNIKKKTKI